MRLALRRCSGVFQKPKREVVAVPVGSVVGLDDGIRQRAGRWQWRECAALLRTVSDTAVTMFSGRRSVVCSGNACFSQWSVDFVAQTRVRDRDPGARIR